MNKKEALKILIKNSYLLTQEEKFSLLSEIENYSEEVINALGKFLAIEKKIALEDAMPLSSGLHVIIDDLNKESVMNNNSSVVNNS